MASGSCLPSAAEDGMGHQTNGVSPGSGECLVGANLGNGCPGDNSFRGSNVFYGNVAGEPFENIPTYWAVRKCGDGSWVCLYFVACFSSNIIPVAIALVDAPSYDEC